MADGADVTNFEQVTAMVERATKEWGSVDLLCANAGILRDKSFTKMEVADFAQALDVHLTGSSYCCKAVSDGMRERNYGRIVLITSSAWFYCNVAPASSSAAHTVDVTPANVTSVDGRTADLPAYLPSPPAPTQRVAMLVS